MGETWNSSDGLPVTVEQVRDAERQLAADPIRLPENLRDPDVVWERIMSRPKRERSTYRVWRIEWSAWPPGARIPSHGEVEIAAESRDDAIRAAVNRWPLITVESASEVYPGGH